MAKTRAAKVQIDHVTYTVTCPYCTGEIENPTTGSIFWTGQELHKTRDGDGAVICGCGESVALPKSATKQED